MDKVKDFLENMKTFYNNNKRLTISLMSVLVIALVLIPVVNSISNNDDEKTNETGGTITVNYETDVVNTNGELNNLSLLHTFIDQVNNNEPALIRYVTDIDGELTVMNLDYDGQFITTNRSDECTFEDAEQNNPCLYEDRFAWIQEDGFMNYYLTNGSDTEKILAVDLSIATNKDFYNTLYTIDYDRDVIIKDNGQTIQNAELLRSFYRSTNTYRENELNVVEITDSGLVEVTTLHFDGYNIHVNNHKSSDDDKNCRSSEEETGSCEFSGNTLTMTDDLVRYTVSNPFQSEMIVNVDLNKDDTENDEQDAITE